MINGDALEKPQKKKLIPLGKMDGHLNFRGI